MNNLFNAHLLLNPELKEHQCVELLKKLNIIFTQKRENLESYSEARDLVSAYTTFYMPTNMVKLSFVLNKLSPTLLEHLQQSHFIDIGTGPGTYLWAWWDYFKGEVQDLFGVDRSELMLEQAAVCAEKIFETPLSVKLSKTLPRFSADDKKKKTLFFGHSLDEMGLQEGLRIINQVHPDFLIILGPGTSPFFRTALELRTKLLSEGWDLHYPCPHQWECPLEKEQSDWCHQIVHHVHDEHLERLSQLIQRDRRTMPLIAHVYSKAKVEKISADALSLQFLNETKFSFEFKVCHQDGQTKKIEILKKDLDKKTIKEMRQRDIGGHLNFEVLKALAPTQLRVKITSF